MKQRLKNKNTGQVTKLDLVDVVRLYCIVVNNDYEKVSGIPILLYHIN